MVVIVIEGVFYICAASGGGKREDADTALYLYPQ